MSNVDDNNTVVSTTSSNINNSNNVTHLSCQNLKSARSAILFTKNATFHSRTTLTLWLLNRMFEPIDPGYEHEGMSFLEISNNALSSVPSTPTVTQQQQQQQDEDNNTGATKITKEAMILTPRTRILSIANEYSIVIMADLTSSLATTDINRGNIMIDNIYDILCNILTGLAQPFSMPTTTSSNISFEPTIRLTVIAECSQFGSNSNVTPILAEFPTMRVFLQNVRVTQSNVSSILKILHDYIATFLSDLATFRQRLTKRGSKLGYELDVRRNHSSGMIDQDEPVNHHNHRHQEENVLFNSTRSIEQQQHQTASASTQQKPTKKKVQKDGKSSTPNKKSKTTKTSSSQVNSNIQQKLSSSVTTSNTTTNRSSSQQLPNNESQRKKDTWGVGKTGSNLSYILYAALFALNLLPRTGQQSLILLTDGVVKSNIQDELIIRQLSSDGVACSVVQISPGPFMDCNFGFIPDTDILKFVASATGGQYVHIEELLVSNNNNKRNNKNTAKKKPSITTAKTTIGGDILDRIIGDLTLPQRKFLLHELSLDKSAAMIRTTSTTPGGGVRPTVTATTTTTTTTTEENSHQQRSNEYLTMGARNGFPWNPHAEPEMTESKLLRYQEYTLPNQLSHVISARTRQGFSLHSITLDRRRATPLNSSSSLSRGITMMGTNNGKKTHVVITLSLQWQPQITIEYRIRAVLSLLSSSSDRILSSYFGTGTIFEDGLQNDTTHDSTATFGRFLASLTNPKAEILIRANSTFSHLLRNWDQFQRRFQVMGIFNNNAGASTASSNIGNLSGSAGILKISKLKQLLTTISEADKHLNTLLMLNSNNNNNINNTNNRNMMMLLNQRKPAIAQSSPVSYISRFQEVWQKVDDSSDIRHQTSCWYDTNHNFDLILHFTPYYCYTTDYNRSNHNSSASNNVTASASSSSAFIMSAENAVISTVLDVLIDLLRQMTDFVSNRGTFIKVTPPTTADNDDARMYEIQVTHENLRTIHIDVRFFNTPLDMRLHIMEELMHITSTRIDLNEGQILTDLDIGGPTMTTAINDGITTTSTTTDAFMGRPSLSAVKIAIAKRPLFNLLMRDSEHYFGITKEYEEGGAGGYYRKRLTTPALLAGEYIVRNYLRRQRWSWDTKILTTDGEEDGFYGLQLLHDLAFERLCKARLAEGYVLISFNEATCHFYKEYKDRNNTATERSSQYFIWRDPTKQILTTELWLEPVTRREAQHRIIERDIVQTEQRRLFQQDRKILSKLITFDWTFVAGYQQQREGGNSSAPPVSSIANRTGNNSDDNRQHLVLDNDLVGNHHIKKDMVIDISSILRSSTFSIAVYPCPRQQEQGQQEQDQQVTDNSTHSYNLYLSPSPIPQTFIERQHYLNDNSIIYNDEDYHKMGVVWLQTERYLPLTAPAHIITAVPNKNEDNHSRSWHGNAAASPFIGLIRGGSYNNQTSSACHCPRPDQEFLAYREALSDLPSFYRDVVLTHYYFQQYLRVLADCEMDTKSNLPNDNFWSNFFRETMHAKNSTHASKSTLRLLHRVTDMQCFIKTFNPSTFIAVLIPSLATLVQNHAPFIDDDKNDKSKTRMMTNHLGLLLFECHRQTPTARSGDLYHHHDEEEVGGEEDHDSSSKRGGGYVFKEIDFTSIKESILSPHLTNGYSSSNDNNKIIKETTYNNEDSQPQQQQKVLSDYKSRLLQDITDIYSSCFAKSIYSSLLFGSMVSDQDFDKVLDICEETVLDIDLTGYLNVQTLLRRNGRTSVEEWSSAQQRFNSVLEHHFEPVMYSKRKRQFIYCYRPAHVKIGEHNKQDLAGGNSKLTKLADIVVSAQCPLFIRLEYTLRNPKFSTTKTFPLEFLPTSYNEGGNNDAGANEEQQQQYGSRVNNYEPMDIGSLESPVASADGSSATVRLVCMTIPQTKSSPVIHSRHSHGCPAESPVHHQSSFFDNEGEYRESLSGLSPEKQDALIETKARLTWLLTEEVMHGLLRAGPVTDVVVRYIQSHLMKKNPFVDFPTTMVIPLVFVKDQQMSRRIFLEQLERNSMTPYKLVRVGDCFYATDQKEYNDMFYTDENNDFYRSSETASNNINQQQQQQREGADFYMDLGIELYTDNKSQQQRNQCQQDNVVGSPNDEFCEGLGISIMEPDVLSDEECPTNTSSILDDQGYQQLYWLLIIPRSQTVQIYFYSKMPQSVNRSEIVRMTKIMINHAIERTNKLILLQHLNATRICSKYLLADEDSTNKNTNDMSTDESSDESNNNNNDNKQGNNRRKANATQTTGGNNLVEMLSTSGEEASFTPPKKFRPGQFACDIIFTWRFPLHWRLQPNVALNALSSDVLRHFTVKNRPNIFVCMRDDTVIYCTLRETTVVNHYTDGTSIIDYSITTDEQQGSTTMRGTSPHNSLLTNIGVSDTSNLAAAFSHYHSRAQSAQPTTTTEATTAAYSYSQQQQQDYYSSYHHTGTVATNTSSHRTSPRSSPGGGGKVQSTNSIQLSPEPRKQTRAVESRELVLEVYGVDLPNWISDELVDLLENRLMSHVTLKEVQQFLLRNPGSKLSRADIDFILPVDKPPSVHESMQVPTNIHDIPQFALLLRESILTNSIRVLTGNGLASSLKNYRLRQQYNNMNFGKGFYFTTKDNINNSHGESSSVEELCFYYSCINRTPGVCTDLELCIGQGVAGVIISFHDYPVDGNDLHHNTSTVMDIEKEDTVPRSLLSAFASKSSAGNIKQQQQQYGKRLSIEIWTVGQVDAKALYDHVYKCFRQSMCDYIIEQAVSSTLPLSTAAAIDRQQQFTTSTEEGTTTTTTSLSPFLEDIGNAQLSSLLSSFVHVLEGSFHWNNPSVSMVSYPVKLQPWSLNQVVQRLNADFIDLNSNIKSVIGIRQQEEQDHHQEKQRQSQQQDNINNSSVKEMYYKTCYTSADLKHEAQAMMQPQKNIRYAIISGLTEFSGCKHYRGPTRPEPIAANATTTPATITEDNKSIMAYNRSEIASILRADQNSAHSRHESVASSNVDSNSNNNKNNNSTYNNKLSQKLTSSSYKEASHRRAFHLVIIDADSFTLYTYNCTKSFVDQLVQVIEQAVNHQSNRVRMLQNIMHQKLGLFRHSETFSTILRNSNDNTVSSSSSVSEDESTSSVEILKNLVNNNMYSTNNVGSEPISANTTNISMTPTGRPSLSAASSATRLSNAKVSSSPTTTGSGLKTHSFHPSSSKLLKDCDTALQSAYTSPVTRNSTIPATVEEDYQKQFPDHLTEHGTPFLDTFLQHSQLRAAHDKAFNVYIKWASRYSSAWMQQKQQHGIIEPTKKDRNSNDTNNNASEMMSVTELRLILKSSRLLHFCRTPLVFSDVDPKRSSIFSNTATYTTRTNNIETIQQHHHMEETMIWYEGLAHTFMAEYASYLQSVGMHVIVHGVSGNSNSSKEDQGVYLSYYKVANDFFVRSPVIYLLQVYPGGTIMCEARLTDVFVSVTLYTLHRRYGRLAAMNHSPYMHESSEKRRADFKDFTEECDRFKQKIHVNSFVYDFNLKFIQQSLDQASSLPSSVNLLGIIKNTFSLYYKPANYSRNRIVRGIYELVPNNEEDLGEDNSMTHLLSMVIRNASKYGFESLYTNGVPTACFVSSNDPSFIKTYEDSRTNKSYYRYTLVITDDHHSSISSSSSSNNVGRDGNTNLGMSHQYDYADSPQQDNFATTPTKITTTKSDSKVSVEYFIIVTYQEDQSEGYQAKKERAWNHSPGYKSRSLTGSLEEVLKPEKHTLKDVTQRARQRIDDLMKQAVFLYQQDVMWNQLYQFIGNKKMTTENVQEFVDLADGFYTLDAISTEASLQRFLHLNLTWDYLLNTIHQFYPNTSRVLIQQLDSSFIRRHLILFNPSAVQEYFVHIIVSFSFISSTSSSSGSTVKQEKKSVQIFAKSKQPRVIPNILDRTEKLFIGDLAVNLGYCLWKDTK